MTWTKLAPIVKTSGRPMASASIVVNKDGAVKISLILSASLKDEFGDPKLCDISAGEGENEGSVLVEFTPKGAFEIKNFVHGGARIYLPVPEGWPDNAATSQPCSLGAKTLPEDARVAGGGPQPDSVVIKLPVEAWRTEIAQRVRPTSGGTPIRTPAPPPAAQGRQQPAAGCRRVPERQGREDLAPGARPLPGRRRGAAARPGAEPGQRQAQGLRPRPARRLAGVVRP